MAVPALAGEPAVAPASPAPIPQGYAFERPELLADQLLWGIAHGARLLALACAQAGRGEAAEAWVAWQERERAQILAANRSLGLHYFGKADAPADAISTALGLASALALPPEQLAPACASLATALARPRYDLGQRREELLVQRPAQPSNTGANP
jgi:hypothetical protein